MSSKQCNSLQMLFAFHLIIACHAMFFESLLIYYLFHFFHFPFFCMLFLLFLPFLQSSVPVCRHNGDDRTGSSRLVSHSCLSYFSALLSGKTSLGRGSKKGKCSLQGKTMFQVDCSHKYNIIFKAGKSVWSCHFCCELHSWLFQCQASTDPPRPVETCTSSAKEASDSPFILITGVITSCMKKKSSF